jgi:hypothetical protein
LQLLEAVLLGNGDGDLGFDLEELVFHVEKDLLGELLGILGFVEEVVEVGTEEGGDTVEERHGVSFQC